jgi:hypothetical protein
MITQSVKEGDMSLASMNEFPAIPVLSHHNLSMDHILLSGEKLRGIVGRSQYDYVPEVADKLKYHFAQPPHEDGLKWNELMSQVLLLYRPPPPLYH